MTTDKLYDALVEVATSGTETHTVNETVEEG
jgi:hypothetical protein